MADTFEDLGISPELVAGVEALGWDAPGGLQRDALPVIRRGNNIVLHASAGSGVVGAYGLGLLDQLAEADEGDALAALILVPDTAAAARTADSLARLAAPAGRTARAHGPGWAERRTDLLVTSPADAMAAVRDSALKLDGLRTLVIDGADQLADTGQWEDVETLADIVPAGAQRIVVTGTLDARIDRFAERHVRRALTVPPRPAEGEETPRAGSVHYRVVPEGRKPEVVASLLTQSGDGEVAVVCRTHDRAEAMERALAARGATDGDARVLVLPFTEADQRSTRASVISADVPFDADALEALHGKGGTVLVTPRERAHLARIASRAGIRAMAVPDELPAPASAAEAVRDRVRSLLESADLAADLALIEPLLEIHPAAEVAAAALHLARTGGAEAAPAREAGPAQRKRPGAGAPPPATTTWVHLFMTVGDRDGANPGDIVGAMTGEAGIDADQVGKIDIRESHTTVEVATAVADRVIEALNGRTIKGRSVRVDYDRKGSGERPSGGRGDRGGSGGSRRPTRGGRRPGGRPRGRS